MNKTTKKIEKNHKKKIGKDKMIAILTGIITGIIISILVVDASKTTQNMAKLKRMERQLNNTQADIKQINSILK